MVCCLLLLAGASALHEAAYSGRAAAIDLLVNSGSNLVLRDADGNTVSDMRLFS